MSKTIVRPVIHQKPFKIKIRENATGETVETEYIHYWESPETTEERNYYIRFWWEEGNGACDCNRGGFFHRARGEEDKETCGEVKYSVDISDEQGEPIYSDMD